MDAGPIIDETVKKRRPLWLRIAIWGLSFFLILLIAGFFYVRTWLNGYLQSDAFRQLLGHVTSQQLKARCEYAPFHFAGFSVNTDNFKAQGTAKAAFSSLELTKIHTALVIGGLMHKSLEIDEVSIGRLQVSLGHTGAPPVPESEIGVEPEQPKPASPSHFGWITPKLDLRKVVVHDTNVLWGENTPQAGAVKGTEVTVKPDGDDAWNVLLQSGTVSQKGGPDLNLDHVKVRYQGPVVTIQEGLFKLSAGGNIAVNGEVNTEKHLDVQVKVTALPLKPFLPPDVQAKLRGTLFADVKVSGPMPVVNPPEVSGSGHLENGDIEGIAALDFIAKLTRSPQFRKIKLHQASADFIYSGQKVTVSNIVVESKGLVSVEGGFTINNSNINGTFQIGLPHDLVKWLPGLEARVFTSARGNYRWTTMHLTGPLKSPKEDLSGRIALAIPMSALDIVGDATKIVPKVPEAPKKLLDGLVKPLFK